jgi:hypothetical protein
MTARETPGSPRAARRGRSFKLVGGVFFALIALGLAGAVFVYFTMIRYERVAALHLPPETTSAVRLDLEKVVLYEPFRKHLLPLVDELGGSGGGQLAPRLKRIQQETKIELALDVRELAVARGPAGEWALALGGKFPKTGVVSGLAEVLREEGIDVGLEPDQRVLGLPRGVSLGQADDGAIVVASSRRWLAAALPAQETGRRLGLAAPAAASFAASPAELAGIAQHPAALVIPALREASRVQRVTGEVGLGSPLRGAARVELEPGVEPAAAVKRVESLVAGLEQLAQLAGSDVAGEARILSSARVSAGASGAVWIGFEWQRQDVDRAAGSLADRIRGWAAASAKK